VNPVNPMNRRDALKFGGITISLGALVAACGENRTGDDAPGRVGNAPPATDLPDLPVDQAVLFRTAASLELTVIDFYETAIALDAIPPALEPMLDRLLADHQSAADRMNELAAAAGGEEWTCPNPWYQSRVTGPILEAITAPGVVRVQDEEGNLVAVTDDDGEYVYEERSQEDIVTDIATVLVSLEDLATASHQELSVAAEETDGRITHVEVATLEARHSSTMTLALHGADNVVAPSLLGEEDGRGVRYAIPSTFAQTSQIEVLVGAPDENGVIESFSLQTPAANSFVYNELSCEA
jgi:hypothetical protein